MNECTVMTFNEKLKTENAQIIDVRERAEFAGGRVAQAKAFPLGELEKRTAELDCTKPIYVICRMGRRSSEAQKKLNALGFNNVINVKGGGRGVEKRRITVRAQRKCAEGIGATSSFDGWLTGFCRCFSEFSYSPLFHLACRFHRRGLIFAAVNLRDGNDFGKDALE